MLGGDPESDGEPGARARAARDRGGSRAGPDAAALEEALGDHLLGAAAGRGGRSGAPNSRV